MSEDALHPAAEHPNVLEGFCTCPQGVLDFEGRTLTGIACWSLTCGLSAHRVNARRDREKNA